MNTPIINPETLTEEQREKIHSIYEANNFYHYDIAGDKADAENDLLECLFGEEFFNKKETKQKDTNMKLIAFIHPTPKYIPVCGTYNGYVAVPPEHPCYGKNYEEVDVNVHGGLTYGGIGGFKPSEFIDGNTELPDNYWVFGFDTCHAGDNSINWNKEAVIKETLKLKEQLEKLV